MYSLGFLLLCWMLGYLFIDWKRTRELLPAILTATLLVGIPVAIPGLDPPYQYVNVRHPTSDWTFYLIVQMGIAPIVAGWFSQGMAKTGPFPWNRVLRFTLLFWGWEQWSHFTGTIQYTTGWGPVHSLLLKAAFAATVALVHRYTNACSSPHQRGDRSVREVTIPCVLPAPGHTDMATSQMDH